MSLLFVGCWPIFDEIDAASYDWCEYHFVANIASHMEALDIIVFRNASGMDREWINHCCKLLAVVLKHHKQRPWIVIDDESLVDLRSLFAPAGIPTYIGKLGAVASMRRQGTSRQAA